MGHASHISLQKDALRSGVDVGPLLRQVDGNGVACSSDLDCGGLHCGQRAVRVRNAATGEFQPTTEIRDPSEELSPILPGYTFFLGGITTYVFMGFLWISSEGNQCLSGRTYNGKDKGLPPRTVAGRVGQGSAALMLRFACDLALSSWLAILTLRYGVRPPDWTLVTLSIVRLEWK